MANTITSHFQIAGASPEAGFGKSLVCTPGAVREITYSSHPTTVFNLKPSGSCFSSEPTPEVYWGVRAETKSCFCSFTWVWLMMLLQTLWSGSQTGPGCIWRNDLASHLPVIVRVIAQDLATSRLEVGLAGGDVSIAGQQHNAAPCHPPCSLQTLLSHTCFWVPFFFFLRQRRELNYPYLLTAKRS